MIGRPAVLIAVLLVSPPAPAPAGEADELRLRPVEGPAAAARPVPLTGVDRSKMGTESGWRASGPRAREFALSTLARHGDDRMPNTSGSPWLVLIGPDGETEQVEGQIPDDVKTLINVARYEPDDPRLDRGFKQHYPGGTYAILMGPDRRIAWRGLVALTELLRQINRLIGREPEPSPWDPPIPLPPLPIPIPSPSPPGAGTVLVFLAGLVVGVLLVGMAAGLAFAVSVARRWSARIREALAAIHAVAPAPTPTPADPPGSPRPN